MATGYAEAVAALEEAANEIWADEDKYAVCSLTHAMGTRDYRWGACVTKNWTEDGLMKMLAFHEKKAIAANACSHQSVFYLEMKEEAGLYCPEKVASYPTLKDCLEHMGMMFKWERPWPVFLVPEGQLKAIHSYAN